MKKRVELPLVEPMYSTLHYHGNATAIIGENPSIRNWYLNHAMILTCGRKFLSGYTSPEINIENAAWFDNPYLEKYSYSMRFAKGYINLIIRELLDNGYYVCFDKVDDYYVEGKTWYNERHFMHDGLICGYDQEQKTYCIYAYDSNWIYRKFYTSQKSFNEGRLSMFKIGLYGKICGIKPSMEQIAFEPDTVLSKLKEYLDSSFENYPITEKGPVHGIVVHDYIAMYLDKLIDGYIPYERMDRRVFRLIWDQKKVMLERIIKMEETLNIDSKASTEYRKVLADADYMRMLYASHHMKRRDSVLPIIRRKVIHLKNQEYEILTEFIKKAKEAMDR